MTTSEADNTGRPDPDARRASDADPPWLVACAPGKAFICGEYAALEGAPALVMAVDRRARVEVRSSRRGWSFRSAPSAGPRPLEIDPRDTASAAGDLPTAVLQEVSSRIGLPHGPHELIADTRSLFADSGHSLGLGSSAALCAALGLALAPHLRGDALCDLAVSAHRRFQSGRGSGYDVVASCLGGLCLIEGPSPPRGRVVPLPAGLNVLLATGGPSPFTTAAVLDRLQRCSGGQTARHVATLVELALRLPDALKADRTGRPVGDASDRTDPDRASDPSDLIDLVSRYGRAEAALGEAVGLDIVSPRVARLARRLEPLGAACKPSGAGGDELVVTVAPADVDPEGLRSALRSVGLTPLGIALTTRGATVAPTAVGCLAR